MNEIQLKTKVLKHIKKTYPTAFVYKTADKFRSGIPDLFVVIDGKLIAIELKVPGGRVSDIQQYTIKQLRDAGAVAGVAFGIDGVDAMIQESCGGTK